MTTPSVERIPRVGGTGYAKTVPLQRESNLEHDRPRHQTRSKSLLSWTRDARRARADQDSNGTAGARPP